MADEKPKAAPDKPDKGIDRPQDPIVDRLKRDPSQPTAPTLTLIGFFGESDRPGYRRLYFTARPWTTSPNSAPRMSCTSPRSRLSSRRSSASKPPGFRSVATPPSITRARAPHALDEFDLDVKLRARPMRRAGRPLGKKDETLVVTCETRVAACDTEANCETQAVCNTQATCETQVTCDTNCGSNCIWRTCETCNETQCALFSCDPGRFTCGQDCTEPTEGNPSDIQTACPTCDVRCHG